MRYANDDDLLHRHQAMQQYAGLPWELIDHIRGIYMVYLQKSQ
jgi:hypothetical protein